MSYSLSATKLKTYGQCPKSYQFRYEHKLPSPTIFGSTKLGNALHAALANVYKDWNYAYPLPSLDWFAVCWQHHTSELTPTQIHEGWAALQLYYERYIAPLPQIRKPLGIETKVRATLQVRNIEFTLSGRYDRLDYIDDGLELIDYKTSKSVNPPPSVDIQLGFYYLILEQIYKKALKRLSLIYLRSNEKLIYEVTPDHHQQAQSLIEDMAMKLRCDQEWKPVAGQHCDRCGYQKYCPAKNTRPEPLPQEAKEVTQVQLALGL
ncbi:RecB family exonuclease [Acaryochloris marina]|uniref:PD-(D/E)XK endonuclease-like domain-containing protein n=1 Tax=Acaryochloris marina (strain MBIC 11017) TaxID=329726 RepID=A8ZQW8_ACAM1|nr:PD-(D/E)XK nuclease family protein [Acaryochloris marina]ABW33404.1 hypothetical protein AM1_H0054 [Acaryochloris marina MBIC11017]